MAFMRYHNKGFNTDWIVRWEDDAAGGHAPDRGGQRGALLPYLTRASVDLGGPSMPDHHTDAGAP